MIFRRILIMIMCMQIIWFIKIINYNLKNEVKVLIVINNTIIYKMKNNSTFKLINNKLSFKNKSKIWF